MKTIINDEREINKIFWPGPEAGWFTVGENDIEKIVPYHENGEQAFVVWFAIYKNGVIWQRYNGKFVDGIEYK
jgi:hypothetical protein